MNETLKTINSLRTIHGNFSDRQISDNDIQTILDSTVHAANASARQSYSIILIEDKDVMKKICGYNADKLLLFCVDYTRIYDLAKRMGHTFDKHNIEGFITGSTDTILAAQTSVIAAKSLGIDSLFTNGIHRGNPKRIYEILNLPEENCFPLIAVLLGYAKTEPEYQKGRIKNEVVHYGKYRHLSNNELDNLISDYDNQNIHLGLIENWQKDFKHYLDWFFIKWSAKGNSEAITKVLKDTKFLTEQE